MYRICLLLLFWLGITKTSLTQSFPELAKSISNSKEAIPTNWIILSSAEADLNKDNLKDIVLVIQNTDPKNIEINTDAFHLGSDSLNLNPRILVIYFKDSISGKFVKQIQANELIPLRDSPTMDEPFDGVEITNKGALKINIHYWYSAGSWFTSHHTYIFRYQNKDFELIGYESSETHRSTGETTDYSINFSTKKMSFSTGNISDSKKNTKWKTFTLDKLQTIKSLKELFGWSFEGINI